jgi:hypothetical protein
MSLVVISIFVVVCLFSLYTGYKIGREWGIILGNSETASYYIKFMLKVQSELSPEARAEFAEIGAKMAKQLGIEVIKISDKPNNE